MTRLPPGWRFAIFGVRRDISSKSSIERSTSASAASASRWRTAFVDPPIAVWAAIAFSNDSRERMSEGRRSFSIQSIASSPARSATA